ncbi:IS110 family transposase [Streptococcus suis]|nr:IS110 family transposase [Streptococcus suis]
MNLPYSHQTGKTPVLERMLSKYVGRQTSSIENDITKTRNHSRQRGNIMRAVFGIAYLAEKLIALANQSYCAVKKTSPMLEEVRYYAQELLRLSERRKAVLDQMVELAQPLPEYDILLSIPGIAETTATSIIGELGDIRRFQSANQINAFIGIDLRHYESGNFLAKEHITKRGNPYARKILFKCIHNIASASHTNPCHIADFYEKRKRQSQTTSTKPHTIASIHRLIRTMYYLIMHNKLYDYASTQNR